MRVVRIFPRTAFAIDLAREAMVRPIVRKLAHRALVQVTAEIRGEGRERHLITSAVTADHF